MEANALRCVWSLDLLLRVPLSQSLASTINVYVRWRDRKRGMSQVKFRQNSMRLFGPAAIDCGSLPVLASHPNSTNFNKPAAVTFFHFGKYLAILMPGLHFAGAPSLPAVVSTTNDYCDWFKETQTRKNDSGYPRPSSTKLLSNNVRKHNGPHRNQKKQCNSSEWCLTLPTDSLVGMIWPLAQFRGHPFSNIAIRAR